MRSASWGSRARAATLWGLAGLAVCAPAAEAGRGSGKPQGKQVSAAEQEAAKKYWTAERMAAAKPARPAVQHQGKSPVTATGAGATGAPGFAGGMQPDGLASSAEGASYGGNASPEPAHGSYPGPHQTWPYFAKYRRYPISTIGRLFTSGGSCSASATIGSSSFKDVVWTAGHCVSNGRGTYFTNGLFCPSYDNGVNTVMGCWAATGYWAPAEWHNNGNWKRDYGVMTVSNCGTRICDDLTDAVGGLGFAWNFPRDQHWMNFGYPAEAQWNGNKMIVTAAEQRYEVDFPSGAPGPTTNSMGSTQTPGFSGGPWLGPAFDGNGAWINSVNSFYFSSGPNGNEYGRQIQGPYHDTRVCNDWKWWTGWPGTC
jgi:hypothetical protein